MTGKWMLRILIAAIVILATVGSIIMSIIQNKPDVFCQTIGGVAGGLFASYIFGVWGD